MTTGVGLLLVIFGIGSKMGAIYGTGYNTYYWWTQLKWEIMMLMLKKSFETWAMCDVPLLVPVSLTKYDMVTDKFKWKHSFNKRYDMVTDIPNAYFVEVGIYKWHGSPTYTLGRWKWILKKWFEMAQIFKVWKKEMSNYFSFRGTSFGAALHYRSVPMLFAAIADLALINIFNRCFLSFQT